MTSLLGWVTTAQPICDYLPYRHLDGIGAPTQERGVSGPVHDDVTHAEHQEVRVTKAGRLHHDQPRNVPLTGPVTSRDEPEQKDRTA